MASVLGGRRAAIVGCGVAGRRIAAILRELGVPAARMSGHDVRPTAEPWWLMEGVPVYEALPSVSGAVWFVCAPASERVPILQRAADWQPAGIFCEKPLGTVADIDLLAGAVKAFTAMRVPNQIGYCWRWHPAVATIAEWLAETRGESLAGYHARAVCACDMSTWPGAGARTGAFMTELSHELDTVRYLFGAGDVVGARRLGPMGCVVTVQHDAGLVSTVELRGDSAVFARSIDVRSQAGSIDWYTDAPDFAGWSDGEPVALGWKPDDMFRDELHDFMKVIDGEPARASLRSGLAVLRWCATATRMMEAGA